MRFSFFFKLTHDRYSFFFLLLLLLLPITFTTHITRRSYSVLQNNRKVRKTTATWKRKGKKKKKATGCTMLIFCCCSHYCRSTNCTRNLTGWLSMKGFDHLFISFFDLFPLKVEFNVAFPNEYRLFFYTSFSLLVARSTKEEPHDVGISGLVFFLLLLF